VSAPASESRAGETLFVPSRLFGPLHLPAEEVIVMPAGMLGFAGERRFVLLPAAPDGVFWFQNVDDGSLIFLLVDPFQFFPEYEVDAPEIPESRTPEVLVLSIVTLPRRPGEDCTVNLQGPLVIDFATRRANQVIQADPRYHTRHPVDLAGKLG